MKPNDTLRGALKRKSVFYKALGLLMVLSIITMAIFGVFINHLVVKNQQKNIDELNLLQLQRIGSDVELVFDLLARSMVSSMGSRDFISTMITPDLQDADTAFRVIGVLENHVEENDLVRKAYWYIPYTEEVYVYSGTYMKLEYLGDRDMIYNYLEGREEGRDPELLSQWKVVLHNRRIFLAVDYCIPNFLGVLFFEINRAELYDIIQAENKNFDTTVYVYDPQGQLLFDYMAGGLQQSDFEQTELFMGVEDSGKGAASYYLHISETLNWKFLTRINSQNVQIVSPTLLSILLPVLAVYILVSLLFSIYITRSIYEPINRLMQLTMDTVPVQEDGGNSGPIQTEVDYLELAYLDSISRNKAHHQLMQSISSHILEQMMRRILNGTSVNMQQIQETMIAAGQEAYLQGRYVVLAGLIQYSEEKEMGMVEIGLCQRSVLRLLEQTQPRNSKMIAFFTDKDLASAILCFAAEVSLVQIKNDMNRMEEAIQAEAAVLPFRMKFGKGRVYEDITSLQFSYHEAVDNARYVQYIGEDPEGEKQLQAGAYESQYYIERAKGAIQKAEKGLVGEAEQSVALLVEELYTRGTVNEQCLRDLIDDVVQRLISSRITPEEMRENGISGEFDEILQEPEREKQKKLVLAFYSDALQLVALNSRRRNNKYVLETKEYVASHYMDGNLSLGKISEYIGISMPYLSGIFTEATGENFSAYLNGYRIEQAQRFLRETNLNISEIGYKCGFNSAQSFGRVFKKKTGYTPKQYRDFLDR